MNQYHIMYIPENTGLAKGETISGNDEISVLQEWRKENPNAEFIYIKIIK